MEDSQSRNEERDGPTLYDGKSEKGEKSCVSMITHVTNIQKTQGRDLNNQPPYFKSTTISHRTIEVSEE